MEKKVKEYLDKLGLIVANCDDFYLKLNNYFKFLSGTDDKIDNMINNIISRGYKFELLDNDMTLVISLDGVECYCIEIKYLENDDSNDIILKSYCRIEIDNEDMDTNGKSRVGSLCEKWLSQPILKVNMGGKVVRWSENGFYNEDSCKESYAFLDESNSLRNVRYDDTLKGAFDKDFHKYREKELIMAAEKRSINNYLEMFSYLEGCSFLDVKALLDMCDKYNQPRRDKSGNILFDSGKISYCSKKTFLDYSQIAALTHLFSKYDYLMASLNSGNFLVRVDDDTTIVDLGKYKVFFKECEDGFMSCVAYVMGRECDKDIDYFDMYGNMIQNKDSVKKYGRYLKFNIE